MSSFIYDQLHKSIDIKITPSLADQLNRLVIAFEIYKEHPMVLNSKIFGVNKFVFASRDRDTFFDIIDIDERDMKDAIKAIPSIDKSHKVVSDEFNIACVYLAHLILNSKLPKKLQIKTIINVLNYQQYRFMASAVNHYFPHGANYDIMQSVVEGLSLKFAIKRLGSWKKVITERSESLTLDTKLHHGTLAKFDDDKAILYLITDTSTRIRSQLQNVVGLYYEVKKANDFMLSYSSTTEIDGQKVLKEVSSSFEHISGSIFHKILRKSPFINDQYIKMVKSSVPTLNIGIIKRMIIALADEAIVQNDEGNTTKIVNKRDGTKLIVGIESLVEKLIYLIYDSAVHNKNVNINSKIAVYTNTRNLFAVHRSSDSKVLNTKMSIVDLIKRNRVSTRDATVSSLTIALCLYICLLSFEHM